MDCLSFKNSESFPTQKKNPSRNTTHFTSPFYVDLGKQLNQPGARNQSISKIPAKSQSIINPKSTDLKSESSQFGI